MNRKKQSSSTRLLEGCILFAAGLAVMVTGCTHSRAVSRAMPPTSARTETIVQPLTGGVVDYAIGAGDLLEISVWKDQALTRQVVVLPDGTISFPLVGQFSAAGKTVEQLRSEMEKKLTRFIPEPELSVIVQQVNSLTVYVIGKVNRPGHIPLNRNVDVLQALSMAGGLNVFANQEDIRIFRKTEDKTMVIPFNYRAVAEDSLLEGNIQLQRGDVIVVK